MSLHSVFNSVKEYMCSNYMFVDEEWLSDCVSYLFENNINEQEIKLQTKEQWLLNDLKGICPGCLPANINNQIITELPGRYVLQINKAIDIGTPAYQQYLKLQKVNTENIEATTKYDEKVPSNRVIKLFMTDGVQEVTGIEYKPMRNLTLDIIPGSKILIKGPVICRRGMLLLTENSIELLGGEVKELLIENSQIGVLSSKLGLSITQELNSITIAKQTRNNIPSPHIPVNPPIIDDHIPNFDEDDIDIDQLDAIEAQFSDNSGKRPSDDDITNPEKKLKINSVSSSNSVDDYPEDNMFFEDEEYHRELEAEFDAKERELSGTDSRNPVLSEPFVYLKQINDLDEIDRIGKVLKVKAQILKVLSKLSVGKDGWSLSCTIVDGTGSLDVDFSSDVLSKLVGFTPQEMINMKKEMSTKPKVKDAVVLALQKAKDTLQVLYCIIEITIIERPMITQLIPFECSHVDALRKRLQDSGI